MVSGEVGNDRQIKMTISRDWTWINFILSIIGSVSGNLIVDFGVRGRAYRPYASASDYFLSFLPTFVPAGICLVFLYDSEMLCSSCLKLQKLYSCFNVNLPILYKTGVDINDISKVIDLQTGQECGTDKDEEMKADHELETIDSPVY